MQQSIEHAPPLDTLTPREREVAALVAEGLTNAEIARRLTITPGTVANHIEHIMRALRVRGRVHVAVWAVRQGLR
jgi:DNA-binding NarL/FixJ family response regulator